MCKKSGTFLDHLVENMGTKGDKKFHVASYLKQFFNGDQHLVVSPILRKHSSHWVSSTTRRWVRKLIR